MVDLQYSENSAKMRHKLLVICIDRLTHRNSISKCISMIHTNTMCQTLSVSFSVFFFAWSCIRYDSTLYLKWIIIIWNNWWPTECSNRIYRIYIAFKQSIKNKYWLKIYCHRSIVKCFGAILAISINNHNAVLCNRLISVELFLFFRQANAQWIVNAYISHAMSEFHNSYKFARNVGL